MQNKSNKKTVKILIVILSVLLSLSVVALAGTVIYNKINKSESTSAVVPDNLITPEKDISADSSGIGTTAQSAQEQSTDGDRASAETAQEPTTMTTKPTEDRQAALISLYDKQPQDNHPFKVGNMFPGDSETKYFRVSVSYKKTVTVHYHADVRAGYEKLAEVLKSKVTLLTTGEVLYDGLMRDMPKSITHKLNSAAGTTDKLCYKVTVYLDTSVGNEYQNKDLIADFRWWVEETDNLEPPPFTGVSSGIVIFAVLAAVSAAVLIILIIVRRRKEDDKDE